MVSIRKISAAVLSVLMAASCAVHLLAPAAYAGTGFTEVSPTKNINVRNDDGNGSVFRELPVNYVKFGTLALGDAKIVSGSGYSIVEGLTTGNSGETPVPLLVWTGKVSFGGARRTGTTDAVTKSNALPPVKLLFTGSAELSDGKTADVEITIDDITLDLTKSMNSSITSSSTVKVPLLRSTIDRKSVWMCMTAPKTSLSDYDHNSMAGGGVRYKVSIRVLDHSTGAPIDAEKYPSMLIVFKDLDVVDENLASHGNDIEYWEQRFKGRFAEGVELVSGWGDPVVLAHEGADIYNKPLVCTKIIGNNLQIKGDGKKYQEFGSKDDSSTYYSGFAAPVKPQGFSYYWTGSIPGNKTEVMGTLMCTQPTVAVWSKRTEGGSLTNAGLNTWNINTHLMNSSGVYAFRPDSGYYVKSLKVDGENISLTEKEKNEGGEYIFSRLNKNPISERIERNGNILEASDSSHYEIEAVFERVPSADLKISKNVTGSLGDVTKEFEFTVRLKGLPAGFTGRIVNNGAVTGSGITGDAFTADGSGSAVLGLKLSDDDNVTFKSLPAGTVVNITEGKSDHDPFFAVKAGDTIVSSGSAASGSGISTGEFTLGSGGSYTAAFVNHRDIAVITGVPDERDISYTAALIMGAAGLLTAGAAGLRKRS